MIIDFLAMISSFSARCGPSNPKHYLNYCLPYKTVSNILILYIN
nr:MAG TPA: hypothetical protein [Caudoviricetes sp.]